MAVLEGSILQLAIPLSKLRCGSSWPESLQMDGVPESPGYDQHRHCISRCRHRVCAPESIGFVQRRMPLQVQLQVPNDVHSAQPPQHLPQAVHGGVYPGMEGEELPFSRRRIAPEDSTRHSSSYEMDVSGTKYANASLSPDAAIFPASLSHCVEMSP